MFVLDNMHNMTECHILAVIFSLVYGLLQLRENFQLPPSIVADILFVVLCFMSNGNIIFVQQDAGYLNKEQCIHLFEALNKYRYSLCTIFNTLSKHAL